MRYWKRHETPTWRGAADELDDGALEVKIGGAVGGLMQDGEDALHGDLAGVARDE